MSYPNWNSTGTGVGYPSSNSFQGSALPPSATSQYDPSDFNQSSGGGIIPPAFTHSYSPNSPTNSYANYPNSNQFDSNPNGYANYGVGFSNPTPSSYANYGVAPYGTNNPTPAAYGTANSSNWNQGYGNSTSGSQYGSGTAPYGSNDNYGNNAPYGNNQAPYGVQDSFNPSASGYNSTPTHSSTSGLSFPSVPSTVPGGSSYGTNNTNKPSVTPTGNATNSNTGQSSYPATQSTGNYGAYSSSSNNPPAPSGTISPPYSPPPIVKPTGNNAPVPSVGQSYPPTTTAASVGQSSNVGQSYPSTTTASTSNQPPKTGQNYPPTQAVGGSQTYPPTTTASTSNQPPKTGQNYPPTQAAGGGQTYPPTSSTGGSYGQTYPPTSGQNQTVAPVHSTTNAPASPPPSSAYSFYGGGSSSGSSSSYPPASSGSNNAQSYPPASSGSSNVGQSYPPSSSNVGQSHPPASGGSSSVGQSYPPSSSGSSSVGQSYPPSSSNVGQSYPPASGGSGAKNGQSYPPASSGSSSVGQSYPPAASSVGQNYPPSSSTSLTGKTSSRAEIEEEMRKKTEEATRLELEKHKAQHDSEKKQKDEEINRLKEETKRLQEIQQTRSEEEKLKQEQAENRREEEAIKQEKMRIDQEEQKRRFETKQKEDSENMKKEMEKIQMKLQTTQLELEENRRKSLMVLEEEKKKREEFEQQILQQKMAASSSLTAPLPPPALNIEGSVNVSSPMMEKPPTTPRPNPAMEIDPKDIVVGSLIGKGAFGEVFRAKLFGKEVAVKKLIVDAALDDKALEDFRGEVSVMSGLRHPNILLLMGACTLNASQLMIVTEIAHSSIDRLLKDTVNPPSFKQRLIWARDTALGLNWLHCMKPPFLHLDLKAGNLLVDHNKTVKVSDFGMSQIKHAGGGGGTPLWMSPEMLLEKPFTEKTDIYSYSITLWEIFTGGIPFDNSFESYDELVDAVCLENERPKIPPTFPTKLKNLIANCWDVNPDKRPSLTNILNDDIFAKILVDYCIPEGTPANSFWVSHFLDKDQIPWEEFREKLFSHFSLPTHEIESKSARLKLFMTDNKHRSHVVTIESFATVVAVLDFDKEIMNKAAGLTGSPWFHGDLGTDETERFLGTMALGTWLVRSDSTLPQILYLSVKDRSFNKIAHYPITAKSGRFSFKGTSYDSLEAIITKYSKELGLETVCQGSKYSLNTYK